MRSESIAAGKIELTIKQDPAWSTASPFVDWTLCALPTPRLLRARPREIDFAPAVLEKLASLPKTPDED